MSPAAAAADLGVAALVMPAAAAVSSVQFFSGLGDGRQFRM
jgi:hypothetical protein